MVRRSTSHKRQRSMNHTNLEIGCVFTPVRSAISFFEQYNIFEQWMNGSTIFDPTMGSGNLLEALIVMGLEQGFAIIDLPTHHLFGNELNTEQYYQTLSYFREQYGLDMREQFQNQDVFALSRRGYDIVLSNPPWCNFTDLPAAYKSFIKPEFIELDLVSDTKELLWGGSRIDIAALVIQKIMKDFLVSKGRCYCFIPLSLFLNDGAHRSFRSYRVGAVSFSPLEIYDLDGTAVFSNIGTRHGFVVFQRDTAVEELIPYFVWKNDRWYKYRATPLFVSDHPLSVGTEQELAVLKQTPSIEVPDFTRPRQGLNTSGCNALFFFTSCADVGDEQVCLGGSLIAPKKWVYPLMMGKNFHEEEMVPQKWVLLLHHPKTAKPLHEEEIRQYESVWTYLRQHEDTLKNRKGVMIQSMIRKGFWWALLGVGKYSFAPYKIIWEAAGKSTFRPKIINGYWQANQSLQACMPMDTYVRAERILKKLRAKHVEQYLLSMKMKGTQSWAQPGKIKHLLSFTSTE